MGTIQDLEKVINAGSNWMTTISRLKRAGFKVERFNCAGRCIDVQSEHVNVTVYDGAHNIYTYLNN